MSKEGSGAIPQPSPPPVLSVCPDKNEASVSGALLSELQKIAELTKPGQEVGLTDALDLICDVWNIARAAIAKAEGRS